MTVQIQDVRFPSDGIECAATLYRPSEADRPLAGLVMGNGFANVRQMYLPRYAEAFAAAGLAVLAIDYRYLGESAGEPRQQVLPESQCDDLRNALSWLSERPEVDAARLALWGTSFAGGHVLRIASHDPRVKAVVAQVPAIGLWRYLREAPAAVQETYLAKALADRLHYARTGRARMVAITAPEGTESVLGEPGYEWHARNQARHPTFHNAIAAHSLDAIAPYDPGAFAESISPTPLLMILANEDTTTPSPVARAVFERVGQPKELVVFRGDHYDVYDDPDVQRQCVAAAAQFLTRRLATAPGRHGRSNRPT